MKRFIISLIIFISLKSLYSQGIQGTIYNTNNDSVPFATLYVQSLSRGTTSNIEGNYKLNLPKGEHKMIVQYLGYKTQEMDLTIEDEHAQIDIYLEPQKYRIPEVRILASGEDPAYRIMRKAVAMSQYYLNQVEQYDCRVYLKGSGAVMKIPKMFKKTLKKEGVEEGKYFVTENVSDIHFELPDKIDETVLSVRSSGDENDTNPMEFITVSLYHDIEGIISPLSQDAFTYYKYELMGSFYDQDYLVHKIKVIPKREGFDLYSGHIFIVEGFWHLHSVDLKVEQKMFEIEARQVYTPISEGVWMAISHDFDIYAKVMGFVVEYKYVASVSNYEIKLNSKIDHSIYQTLADAENKRIDEEKEVMGEVADSERQKQIQALVQKDDMTKSEARKLKKMIKKEVKESTPKQPLEIVEDEQIIADSARDRSISYWEEARPIPLASYEIESFRVQDSIQLMVEEKPELEDSIKRARWKLTFSDILTGGYLRYPDNHNLSFSGIFNTDNVDYNTVNGLYFQERFRYTHRADSSGLYYSLTNHVGYSVAGDRFYADGTFWLRYNGMKRAWIALSGGRVTRDFNSSTGISKPLNLITTLYFKDNYLKLYEKDYFKIRHDIDIANGLKLEASFEYADRKQLYNKSDFYLTNLLKSDFTSNVPNEMYLDPVMVEDHLASIFSAKLSYTPRYYYRISNNTKYMQRSDFPTFTLSYNKGIKNLFGSDVNYDHLELSVYQHFSVRKLGGFTYRLRGGAFLNSSDMYFQDYKHFSTNEPILIGTGVWSSFRGPAYYSTSTNRSYLEGHLRFRNDRILLKRLPVLNKTLMNESLYFHYLANTGHKPYYELGYGLNQIFLMFNLELFIGFEGNEMEYGGFKIGIPLMDGSGEITVGAY